MLKSNPYHNFTQISIEEFRDRINDWFEDTNSFKVYEDSMNQLLLMESIQFVHGLTTKCFLEKVEFLLQKGVNPNIYIDKKTTLLDSTLKKLSNDFYKKRHKEQIKLAILLLKYGANVYEDTFGLFSHANSENMDLFKELEFYLFSKGVEISITDHVYIGNKETVLKYIHNGGDITMSLVNAVCAVDDNEILKLCLPHIVFPLFKQMQKNIDENRSVEQLDLLCNKHKEKFEMIFAMYPLACCDDLSKMDVFLSKKPNIFHGHNYLLMSIADNGNLAMLKKIINCGAYDKDEVLNAQDKVGNTLLIRHILRSRESPEFVEYVLSIYEDIDAMCKKGHTALMTAVKLNRKSTKIIELLIEYGADPNKKSANSFSAIDYAKKYPNNTKTIEILEQVNGGKHVKAAFSID